MKSRSANLDRDFGVLFESGSLAGLGDGVLLERFIARRDEAAFEELVSRHGPMVRAICRRWLDDARDVDDAFQAVFLILVRKAPTLRDRHACSSWLYGVALRVVRRARSDALRRRRREGPLPEGLVGKGRAPDDGGDEVGAIVDEEIRRLPGAQQVVTILCLREGCTHEAAASELGWPLGTVKSRIAAARRTLIRRLTHRGLAPSCLAVGLGPKLAGPASAAVPPELVRKTLQTIRAYLCASGPASASAVFNLVRHDLRSLLMTRIQSSVLLAAAFGTVAWIAPGLWGSRPGGPTAIAAATSPTARGPEAPAPPPRTDAHGDALPPGAARRLGTDRFRSASPLKRIAYSPDGRLVMTEDGQNRLIVRNAGDGTVSRRIDFEGGELLDFALSPDGKSLATLGLRLAPERNTMANRLVLAEAATGLETRRIEWDDQDGVEKVVYLPDGQAVATVNIEGDLRLWDVATGKLRREQRLGDGKGQQATAFSQGAATCMLAIAWEQSIDLWDVARIERTQRIVFEGRDRPDCFAFSPDGKALAAGVASKGGEIRLWRVDDGGLLRSFTSRKDAHAGDLAFSPDGKILAATGWGSPFVAFDVATGRELDLLPDAPLIEGPLAFSPDGKTLATTGDRQVLHFWNLEAGKDRLAAPDVHQGDVVALAFSGDGKALFSGSRDRTARIWDLATGRSTGGLPHGGGVGALSPSKDGALLATGSTAPEWGTVRLWNRATGELLHTWTVESTLRGLALVGDGASAIAAYGDGSLHLWDFATGKERPIAQPMIEHLPSDGLGGLNPVVRADFSPDARSVALLGGGWLQLVDVATGRLRFKAAAPGVGGPAFAADGRSLAVVGKTTGKTLQAGSWFGSQTLASTVAWLDSTTGEKRREIEVPGADVLSLAFSPDGLHLAVGALLFDPARGNIRIYRLSDGREVQSIATPAPWITSLTFTPDGKRVVAGLSDTSIVFWDLRRGD